MKLNKIFLMAGVAMTMFMAASCSDDDNWSAGPQTNADSLNVFIASDNNVAIPLDGNTFTVVYGRNKTNGSLTIPVEFSTGTPDIFTDVPTSLTFADGAAFDTITITCKNDMELFTTYRATITIPEQYTTQYADDEFNLPRAELNVVKEDYKLFKKGTYYSVFNEAEVHDNVLEYSQIKGFYRVKVSDAAMEHTFTFVVNEDNSITINEGQIYQGWDYPGYGGVYAMVAADKPSLYDPDDNAYYFGFMYAIPAAGVSFKGSYYDYFVVEE